MEPIDLRKIIELLIRHGIRCYEKGLRNLFITQQYIQYFTSDILNQSYLVGAAFDLRRPNLL